MNIDLKDAYDILGVSTDMSSEDIKSRYRTLAKISHPDSGGTNGLFRVISESYDKILSSRTSTCKDTTKDNNFATTKQSTADIWTSIVFSPDFVLSESDYRSLIDGHDINKIYKNFNVKVRTIDLKTLNIKSSITVLFEISFYRNRLFRMMNICSKLSAGKSIVLRNSKSSNYFRDNITVKCDDFKSYRYCKVTASALGHNYKFYIDIDKESEATICPITINHNGISINTEIKLNIRLCSR